MDIEDLLAPREQQQARTADVIIIGSGVVGACVARELSKFEGLSILVLEREADVSQGTSKANSGIVHGGYDTKHGTLKAELELAGNAEFDALCETLSVPFKRIGSLVLSFTEKDDLELERLLENGRRNGVRNLELISRDKVLEMEPHVSVGVRGALHCPGAGIVNPYLFTIANCENAHANGVKFRFQSTVTRVHPSQQGTYSVELSNGQRFQSRMVVNCAGLFSDTLSVPAQVKFTIKPRKGEYLLLSKDQGHLANRILFQAPTIKYGKGVLVTPTVDGNLLLGPSARELQNAEDRDTDLGELAYVAWAARKTVPHLDTRRAIRSFAGVRAKSSTGDFVLSEALSGYVICGGIDSPGLTCAPALAKRVVAMLRASDKERLVWRDKTGYISKRLPYDNIALDQSKVVCKCEHVTESTIRESIRRLKAMQDDGMIVSTDSIKLRTRAGMGDCQGFRCEHLVRELIAQETGRGEASAVPKQVGGKPAPKRTPKAEMGRL